MKKSNYIYLALVLLFTLTTANSQTCVLESEIPSTTPNSQLTDNNNGTISDRRTGLMWQKCQLGLSGNDCDVGTKTTHTWLQALDEADSSNTANFNDWRLPNHKELLSIVEQRCYNPSINTVYFPNTSIALFWSASPEADSENRSWRVFFTDGISNSGDRSQSRDVRLVRSDQ